MPISQGHRLNLRSSKTATGYLLNPNYSVSGEGSSDEEEVTTVSTVITNGATTTMAQAPKVRVESFSGTPGKKGEMWYKNYSTLMKSVFGYTYEKVKRTFMFHLTDQAKTWYQSLPDSATADVDQLLSDFCARFDGSDVGFTVGMVKQRVGESVHDYTTRFMDQSNDSEMPAKWLISTYIDGLVPSLKRIVKPHDIKTLDLARRAALRAEECDNEVVEVSAVNSSDAKLDTLIELLTHQIQMSSVQQQEQYRQGQEYQGSQGSQNANADAISRIPYDLENDKASEDHIDNACLNQIEINEMCSESSYLSSESDHPYDSNSECDEPSSDNNNAASNSNECLISEGECSENNDANTSNHHDSSSQLCKLPKVTCKPSPVGNSQSVETNGPHLVNENVETLSPQSENSNSQSPIKENKQNVRPKKNKFIKVIKISNSSNVRWLWCKIKGCKQYKWLKEKQIDPEFLKEYYIKHNRLGKVRKRKTRVFWKTKP
ncbi:hypothetical protein ACF0H5_001179 [Mactra antiquata]